MLKTEVTMRGNQDDRTLSELLAELSQDVRTLVRQEILLARTELAQKAGKLTKSAALIVAGGLVAYGGLLAIVAAVVLGLIEMGVPPALAALLGGIATAVIGYVLVRSGLRSVRRQELKPNQTIDSLKEDAQWLRAQTK